MIKKERNNYKNNFTGKKSRDINCFSKEEELELKPNGRLYLQLIKEMKSEKWVDFNDKSREINYRGNHKVLLKLNKLLITFTMAITALITISRVDMMAASPLSSSLPLNAISNIKRATPLENLHDNNTFLRLQQQQQLFAMLTGGSIGGNGSGGHRSKEFVTSSKRSSSSTKSGERFENPNNGRRKKLSKAILANLQVETTDFIADEASRTKEDTNNDEDLLNLENSANGRKNGSHNGNLCPKECRCLNNYFDCAKKHLSHVPALPGYVENLDLRANRLTDISVIEIKNLSKLQHLVLQRNQLEFIPAFEGLENLKHLDLSHNRIVMISSEALGLLTNLNTLDLTRNLIHSIEANYFPPVNNLTHLNLNNNMISKVDENAFNFLTELTDLQMNNNHLRLIPAEAFKNLTKLKKLSLNNNSLELNYKIFKGLISLKKLFLKSNNISVLPDGVFHIMQSIESIELDNNCIKTLSKAELINLTKLNHLSLSNNSISHINPDTWEFTPALQYLDLSHNNISEFKAQHLEGLEHLKHLNLGHNRIQYLMENSFDRVKKLEDLNLRRNKLAWIIEDPNSVPFKALNKLKKLNLYGNNIKQITNKSLSGLNNLDTLNLGGNTLATIEMNAFKHMKKLKKLVFKSLNFICDCNLLWFRRWLHEHFPGNGQMRKNVICGYPEHLLDQEFLSLIESDVECSQSPKPSLKKEPSNQIAIIGTNVTLNCTAFSPAAATLAAADELKIIWRHDVHYMKPHPFYKIVQDSSSSSPNHNLGFSSITTETQTDHDQAKNHTIIIGFLRLVNVSNENAGKYQCIVSNAFGTTYSKEFELTVAVLPKFLDAPSNLTVDTGDTARLVCSATGVPITQIVLQKSGDTGFPAAMERRLRREENAFVITNAQPIDTGIYTCIANSDVGQIKVNTSLFVKDTPKPVMPFIRKESAAGDTTVLECLHEITLDMDEPRRDWFKDNKPFHTSKTSASGRFYFTQDNEILVILNTSSIDAGQYTCEINDRIKSFVIQTELIVVKETIDRSMILIGGLLIFLFCIVIGSLIIWMFHHYQKKKLIRDETRRIYNLTNNNSNHLSASQHILSSSSSNRGSGVLEQTQLTTLQRSFLRQSRNGQNPRPRSLVDIDYKNINSFEENLYEPPHSRLVITTTPDYRNRCRGNFTLQYIPSRFNQTLDQQQDRLSSKDSGTGSDTAAKRSLEDFTSLLPHSSSPTSILKNHHDRDKVLPHERDSLAEEEANPEDDDNFLEFAPTRALGISEFNHDLSYLEGEHHLQHNNTKSPSISKREEESLDREETRPVKTKIHSREQMKANGNAKQRGSLESIDI